MLALEEGTEWLRGFGGWTVPAILGLLVSDVVLPVPTTPLITAAGILHGTFWGGVIGSAGSLGAGVTAFGLARLLGPDRTRRLLGNGDVRRLDRFFQRWGGVAIALSRWMPILPELLAFLAGLSAMAFGRFVAALLCGTVPMAFAYAAVGSHWSDRPGLALVAGTVIPALLWPAVVALGPRRTKPPGDGPGPEVAQGAPGGIP